MIGLIRIRPLLAGTLLVFALLPTMLFGLIMVYLLSSDVSRGYTEQLRTTVAFQVQNLEAFFHARLQQLHALSETPDLRQLLAASPVANPQAYEQHQHDLHTFLSAVAERVDFIAAVQLMNRDNLVLASSAPDEENMISGVAFRVAEMTAGRLHVTPMCALPHSEGLPPHFAVAMPIVEDSKVIGALVYMLNLQALAPSIRTARSFESGNVILFDNLHIPVVANRADRALSGEDLGALKRLLPDVNTPDATNLEGWIEYESGNEVRVASYSILPDIGWGVISSISQDEINATRNKALLWLGVAILVALPILLAVSLLISGYLVRDANRILKNIKSFRDGMLPEPDDPPLRTELAAVNTALRDLMGALNQSNEEKLVAERQFRLALEQTHQLVFEVNLTTNRILSGQEHWGDVFMGPFSTDYDFSVRHTADETVHPEDKEAFCAAFSAETLIARSQHTLDEVVQEFRCMNAEGAYHWVSCTLYPMRHGNTLRGIVCIKDIHDRKVRELEIEWQARKDSLTGLYNKRTTQHAITGILESSTHQTGHALFIIDLDNFKSVNDTLGHQAGDVLLHDFAQLLQTPFRDSDIAGRIGGDEFMVLLKDYHDTWLVSAKAADIIQRAESFFKSFLAELSAPHLDLGVSIGVAIYPKDGEDFAALYNAADAALYKAKKDGKHTWAMHESPEPGREED